MTQISRDAILKLAQLSNLQLVEDEIEGLRNDIENILAYVEQLDELDTDGIEPVYQVTDLENVTREDIARPQAVTREMLLALASETKDNHVKVPKVL